MEFEVLRRKIDIRWSHILLYLGVFLGLNLLISLPGFVYFVFIDFTLDGYLDYLLATGYLLAAVLMPLIAFIFLRLSGIFKMKSDVDFCRSMGGVNFLVMGTISILGFLATIYYGYTTGIVVGSILGLVGTFAGVAFSSIIIYLWMLFWLSPDVKGSKGALQNAALVAIIFLLVEHGAMFIYSTHILDRAYAPSIFGLESISSAVGLFLFAFILLYHMPKRLGGEARLFASLYLVSALFPVLGSVIDIVMEGMAIGLEEQVLVFIEAVLSLALIYALSRYSRQANL